MTAPPEAAAAPRLPERRRQRGVGFGHLRNGLIGMITVWPLMPSHVTAQDFSELRLFPENPLLERNTEGRPYLYGQINKGFLVHSDGNDTNVFPLVDNDNSGTRAGVIYKDSWWSNVTAFATSRSAGSPMPPIA